jgi:RNA polymerase sigma-70 factor (ECF subfamily)
MSQTAAAKISPVAAKPMRSPTPTPAPARRRGAPLDERELTQIHHRYRHLILRRCRRILRDEHAAEDATQTVFMKLWRYGEAFRLAASPLGWLYRVADRCCFDELKRRSPWCDDRALDSLASARLAADPVEDRDLVRRLLGRFDVRVQRIAVLRYCEEMSQDEIAAETCWSRQTVLKKLTLVRDRAHALRGSLLGAGERRKERR